MSEYIIDPNVFYWMNVLGSLKDVTLFVSIMFCIVTCVLAIFTIMCSAEQYEHTKLLFKLTVIAGIVAFVMAVISVFIPSKQTCIQMLVAKTATFENVNWTVEQIKDFIDYVCTALKGV